MPLKSPYRTAPGSIPPELAGRDAEIGAARYAIAMTSSGAAAKPLVFTGLRGMGKTALLRRCTDEARKSGAIVIAAEADKTLRFADVMRRELSDALSTYERASDRLAATIKRVVEYLPKVSYELPHDAGGIAISSNDREDDKEADPDSLEDVLLKLNSQLRRQDRFLLIAIDEIQESPHDDLLRVIRVVHKSASTEEPILLLGAGLPNSPGVLKATRTYTERYAYLRLELLSREATVEAVDAPARKLNSRWEPEASEELYALSQGYPYFVQEYATAAWLEHHGKVVTKGDVERVAVGVQKTLDESLYARQFAQISPREAAYILGLHKLGPGTHYSDDIVRSLGMTSAELGSVRSQLIKKDVLFSPARGLTEFRLPLTESYIDRHIDDLRKRARVLDTPAKRGK